MIEANEREIAFRLEIYNAVRFIRFFVPNLFQWELVGLQPTEKMGSSFVAHLEA